MQQPENMPCRCSICGGGGFGTINTTAAEWTGATLVHANPDVCRQNLQRKADELDNKISDEQE